MNKDSSTRSPTSKEKNNDTADTSDKTVKAKIVVLGEAGAGKTSFIRNFITCIYMKNLEEALQRDSPVPKVFPLEENKETASICHAVKVHILPCDIGKNKTILHFVDTPPICNGEEYLKENCDVILAFLREFGDVHACILVLKPSSLLTIQHIEEGFLKIVKRMLPQICDNLIFIFSSCKSRDDISSELLEKLRRIISYNNLSSSSVKPSLKYNCFYLDWKSHHYINVLKANGNSVEINDCLKDEWRIISEQYAKVYLYLTTIIKCRLYKKQEFSINDLIRTIFYINQPLFDVMHLMLDNIELIKKHRTQVNRQQTIRAIQQLVNIPQIQLDVTPLNHPRTICTDKKCMNLYQCGIKDFSRCDYRTCHTPCALINPSNLSTRANNMSACLAMDNFDTCTQCGCEDLSHIHVYYLTRTSKSQKPPSIDASQITNKRKAQAAFDDLLTDLQVRQYRLEEDFKQVTETISILGNFIQAHTTCIPPFDASYKLLIKRMKHIGLPYYSATVNTLESLLRKYTYEILDISSINLFKSVPREDSNVVSPFEASAAFVRLFALKEVGEKFRELMFAQKVSRLWELHTSYQTFMYPTVPVLFGNNKNDGISGNEREDNETTTNRTPEAQSSASDTHVDAKTHHSSSNIDDSNLTVVGEPSLQENNETLSAA